jgi:hypothetical protein
MRSAGNFHPEWGYLAPAPSFMRTARIVLVATAIGATAGAAVMISLVQHPGADTADTSIAAHALMTSVQVVAEPPLAAAPIDEPARAETPATTQSVEAATASPAPAANPLARNAATKANTNTISAPPVQAPANVAAVPEPAQAATVAETPAAIPNEAVAAPEPTAKPTKKHRTAGDDPTHRGQSAGKRWHNNRPFDPLFRLFSARSGPRNSF